MYKIKDELTEIEFFNKNAYDWKINKTNTNETIYLEETTSEDKEIKKNDLQQQFKTVISLNNQITNEKFASIDLRVNDLESRVSEKDLTIKSLLNEIKFLLLKSKSENYLNKKIFYLNNSKSYLKNLLNTFDNIFDTKSQGISIILDCINYNTPEEIFIKTLDLLIELIESIILETITTERLELYTERIYKNGLKLFGCNNKKTMDDILNMLN